jgi:hypothetical protein
LKNYLKETLSDSYSLRPEGLRTGQVTLRARPLPESSE